MPSTRAALIIAALAASTAARAADIEITWDQDLAFEWDRTNYDKTLREIVRTSHDEASSWLGLSLTRRLVVWVHAPARYEQQFGSDAAWNRGAHYAAGTIHVNGGARLNGWFAGMMAHEMTHAVLDYRGTGRRLPAWLNEGIAERLGWRKQGVEGLDTTQVTTLEVALDQRQLVPLPTNQLLSRFGYLQSYAAVLFLEKKIGKDTLLRVVRRTLQEGTFEAALDAELRWTQKNIEEGFAYWVDHLQQPPEGLPRRLDRQFRASTASRERVAGRDGQPVEAEVPDLADGRGSVRARSVEATRHRASWRLSAESKPMLCVSGPRCRTLSAATWSAIIGLARTRGRISRAGSSPKQVACLRKR